MWRLAPNLTKQHIELPAFSKMKVKRAAQIVSNTVQAAIIYYNYKVICHKKRIIRQPLWKTWTHCLTFLTVLVCRTLNCTSVHYKKIVPRLSTCTWWHIFMRVKIQGSRGSTHCITGWQLSISAVIVLWNDVKSVCGVKYLYTRQLNQYPLENCFSFIRAKHGCCANPDPKQFADAYKQVLIKSCISQSELPNCESDTNSLLPEVFGTPSNKMCKWYCCHCHWWCLGYHWTCSHWRQFATPTKCFVLCWGVYLQEIYEWFVWLLYYTFFAANILQQRIFGRIRSDHP